MTTDDRVKTKGGSLQYTSQQRAFESGTFKFQNMHENRKPTYIEELEHRLSSANSRTGRLPRFLEYLRLRHSVEGRLCVFYSNALYRIHRWWSYNRKRKSEAKLVQRIKDKFDPDGNGSNIVLAYGSWTESQQMRGLRPSPTTAGDHQVGENFNCLSRSVVGAGTGIM